MGVGGRGAPGGMAGFGGQDEVGEVQRLHRLTAAQAGATGTSATLAAWSVRADAGGSVTVTLRELADAAQLEQALAANGVPALLHFGGGACSADHAPHRGPVGIDRASETGGQLTYTITFKVSLWPAGSELYIANSKLGPQLAVIPQGHYQGCA